LNAVFLEWMERLQKYVQVDGEYVWCAKRMQYIEIDFNPEIRRCYTWRGTPYTLMFWYHDRIECGCVSKSRNQVHESEHHGKSFLFDLEWTLWNVFKFDIWMWCMCFDWIEFWLAMTVKSYDFLVCGKELCHVYE
jgi:hypothetical protein